MFCLASSGVHLAVAKMPNPPALQTAATSSGVVTQFIPASIIGCLHPNNSVKGVLIIEFSFVIAELQATFGNTYD
jgi:hypothetical protein